MQTDDLGIFISYFSVTHKFIDTLSSDFVMPK